MIESLGDEGVGGTLIAVAVGWGEGVAVVGVEDDASLQDQAAKISSPKNRNVGSFLKENIGIPSNFNT